MQVSRRVAGPGRRHVRAGRDGHRAQPRPGRRHGLRGAGRPRPTSCWSPSTRRPTTPRSAEVDLAAGRGVAARPRPASAAPRRRRRSGRRPPGRAATVALVSRPGLRRSPTRWTPSTRGCSRWCSATTCRSSRRSRSRSTPAGAGVLVMGPDCGTAVVGGVGLGFANVVRPGPVGIVAASGTGAQHLMALLDGAGVGVSHCLGRRRPRPVRRGRPAGRRCAALDLLDADEATSWSWWSPSRRRPAVADARPRARRPRCRTPVLFGLLGAGQPDLTATAAAVVEAAGGTWAAPEHWTGAVAAGRPGGVAARAVRRRHAVRRGDAGRLGRARPGRLQHPARPGVGARRRPRLRRPHDGRLRRRPADPGPPAPDDRRLAAGRAAARRGRRPDDRRAAARRGARPRPPTPTRRAALVPGAARRPACRWWSRCVGTRDDPQGLGPAGRRAADAGAWVFLSNAAAARCALDLLGGSDA